MTLLEIVNGILPYLGEATVTTTNTQHPTVGLVLQNIATTLESLLAEGWWFNTVNTTLYPDIQGYIAAPNNILAWYSTDDNKLDVRGNKMIDYSTGSELFTVGTSYLGEYTTLLSVEELPIYAQHVIMYTVALNTYVQDIGVEKNVEFISQQLNHNMLMLRQENLRKQKYKGGNEAIKARYFGALRN